MHAYQVWVIPVGQLSASLSKTEGVPALPGLSGMFKTGLTTTSGGTIATHRASAGRMSTDEVAFLMANLNVSWMLYEVTHAQLASGVVPESPLVIIASFGYFMLQAT